MAAEVTKKPTGAVTKLGAPVREAQTRKMKATWKVPSSLVKSDSHKRTTSLEIDWFLGIPGKDPKEVHTNKNERATSDSINLDSLVIGKTKYTRKSQAHSE